MHPFAKAALGAVAAAYANEAFVKPSRIAKLARAYANRVRKPMLTFVPPAGQTLKSLLLPSLAIGDVNLHPAARSTAHGLGQVGRGSPMRMPVPPRTFGSVFSWDVLEHLDRPDLALLEWHRVADRVFIVVPPWWSPDAWLSKWRFDSDLRRAMPVWASQNRTIWLPSDAPRAYDARTCPTPQQRRPSPAATRAPMGQPTASEPSHVPVERGPVSNESAPSMPEPTSTQIANLLPAMATGPQQEEAFQMEEASTSANPSSEPYLPPSGDSASSASVSWMTIISGSDPESD